MQQAQKMASNRAHKHADEDATQGNCERVEKGKEESNASRAGAAGAAGTATQAHSSFALLRPCARRRFASGLGLRLAAAGVVSSQRQTVAMVHKAGHRHRILLNELCRSSLPRQRAARRTMTDTPKGLTVINPKHLRRKSAPLKKKKKKNQSKTEKKDSL
jgi:hypothetical protein